MGVVVRDHEGSVLAAFSKMLHYLLGPLEVEVKALKEAVDFAWDVGIGMPTLNATHFCSLMLFEE